MMAGRVVYYDLIQNVPGVEIELTGVENKIDITDYCGAFLFDSLTAGNYIITPQRGDHNVGVTIADAVKIRRHLAYVERFGSPYQMIAADVDDNTHVSVTDVVRIRLYLAKLEGVFPAGNWSFINSSANPDMDNWSEAPHNIETEITSYDQLLPAFVAVRIGDVDQSWNFAGDSLGPIANKINAGSVRLVDISRNRDGSLSMPIEFSGIDEMAGLELHLSFESENIQSITFESDCLNYPTVNITDDAIHIVWENLAVPVSFTNNKRVGLITCQPVETGRSRIEIGIDNVIVVNSLGLIQPVDLSGKVYFSDNSERSSLPGDFRLDQNRPNPFNPETVIRAFAPEAGHHSLMIYDILGRDIISFHGRHDAGQIEFHWDGRDTNGDEVSSGIYFYRFTTGNFSQTRKMILLK